MAGLKTLLGLYPKTASYEASRKKLEDELKALKEFEESAEFQHYKDLESFLKSDDFASVKKELFELNYKTSEEFKKEREFKELKKDKSLKVYFKTLGSEKLVNYEKLEGSNELRKLEELKQFIESKEFSDIKSSQPKKEFRNSEAYQKFQEYSLLQKDSQIKDFYKFKKSKQFNNYIAVKDSDKPKRVEELKNFVASNDFIERKKYLLLPAKKRWKQSGAFKQETEFRELQKSEKIKWFFKMKGHKKFEWFNTWKKTFEDDFDNGKLDSSKWLTKYYWGEELLQESYSLAHEKHAITDGKNLEFNGSTLKIITRKEVAEGKMWNPELGFVPHTFDFTSGLINSGKGFRQKYGLFEAKIKVSGNSDLINAFWMVGDQMLPHIDVFKAYNKCTIGVATESNSAALKALGRKRFAEEYHVIGMEWEPGRITWKINGLEVASTTKDVPDGEMYLAFSSGLYNDITAGLPSAMEVDWVRCYKKRENKEKK